MELGNKNLKDYLLEGGVKGRTFSEGYPGDLTYTVVDIRKGDTGEVMLFTRCDLVREFVTPLAGHLNDLEVILED